MNDNFDRDLFSARLKEVRKSKDWTQAEMGEFLGISQQAYLRYEKALVQMSYETLYLIAKKLDVSIDYLLGLTSSDYIN